VPFMITKIVADIAVASASLFKHDLATVNDFERVEGGITQHK
jgi:hypothetical protein